MNVEDIMLDLRCVELGIPPLSVPPEEVANLIVSLDSEERKKISRKIKKLCKKYINTRISSLKGTMRKSRKSILERRLSLKSDLQLFNNDVLIRRIDFVRTHVKREERRKIYEEDI